MIQCGNSKIKDIYAGSSKIVAVYAGSEKVWKLGEDEPAFATLTVTGIYQGNALVLDIAPYINHEWTGTYLTEGDTISWDESKTVRIDVYAQFENGGEPVLMALSGPNGYWKDTYDQEIYLPTEGGAYFLQVAVG